MTSAEETFVMVGGKKQKKPPSKAQRIKRRRQQKKIAAGVILVMAFLIWFGFQPLKGDMDYGVCRTFAELRVANPSTMRILSYENYGEAWKIFYTFIGEYGEQRSNYIDCVFTVNPATGQRELREVKINRVKVGKEELKRFNLSIPAVIKGKPNLVIPPPLEKSDLMGLRTIYEE
ncbi:MAG: hypothetical protein HYS17_01295 [Micavibrio aeruginosavorus]|uniref:Uncharacterized protein n=1 Tax=Micavibrio aeruginosavorus TaxID=349221 RepID=A0A7T5UHY8_9BACT|nr:MAG: hypothetical protein HYS17_01295 [Micavibrio aeruginosavorus]